MVNLNVYCRANSGQSRSMVKAGLRISLELYGFGCAGGPAVAARYSSLPRVTTIEASFLVRVHSMLRRRKRIETLSPRSRPIRLIQRVEPVETSCFGIVKMMAPAAATSSKNCGFGLRSVLA